MSDETGTSGRPKPRFDPTVNYGHIVRHVGAKRRLKCRDHL
jgi:hypothetical protein